MKKKILIALTASLIISAVNTAFAAEDPDQSIKIDGSLYTQWRSQRDSDLSSGHPDYTRNGFKALLTLNAEASLNKNMDVYARATYETLQHDWGTFMADYIDNNSQESAAVDAYGVKYKNAGFTYTLGKQYLTIGQGLIYDCNGYIGRHSAPYAVNITGKVGATDISIMAAKTDYQDGLKNDTFYALQGSTDLSPKLNMGAMFAHVSYGDSTVAEYSLPKRNVNFYSGYGTYKLSDKAAISAEFSHASSASDNNGFQTTVSYKLDGKNSLAAGYYYIEDQAGIIDYNIAAMTTGLNSNAKGYLVSYTHQLNKNIKFSVADFNYQKINDTSVGDSGATGDRNRFYTTMTVTF
ncbi:Hypothetical protein LUCI_0449 [Lucifera butyrica]|uniref:Porin domain-containing protein n=1 Tax=Lucifera butyrica TaxID=1351585 RepID=A0A498R4P8_9FIRM|nr:hypothetical protein [Lucifera butyrica]VBB05242.1 Hypothetical protein LUCI_0449 [Lucifera butyrica]